jgi:hypothetical protein
MYYVKFKGCYDDDMLSNKKYSYGIITFLSDERSIGKFAKRQSEGYEIFYQQEGGNVV